MSKHLSQEIKVHCSIVRNEEKCIKCGQSKNICDDYISVGRIYNLNAV